MKRKEKRLCKKCREERVRLDNLNMRGKNVDKQ